MGAKRMISPDMTGCWLDGNQGWRNHTRVMDIARAWGWRPEFGRSVRQIQRLYERNDPDATCKYNRGDVLTYDDACGFIINQGGLCDEATEFLQGRAPEGFVFVWDAGELCLLREEDTEWYGL